MVGETASIVALTRDIRVVAAIFGMPQWQALPQSLREDCELLVASWQRSRRVEASVVNRGWFVIPQPHFHRFKN
jgi:hypothetical protein